MTHACAGYAKVAGLQAEVARFRCGWQWRWPAVQREWPVQCLLVELALHADRQLVRAEKQQRHDNHHEQQHCLQTQR